MVKEDVTLDPVNVGRFGSEAVVFASDRLAHAVEKSGLSGLKRLRHKNPHFGVSQWFLSQFTVEKASAA